MYEELVKSLQRCRNEAAIITDSELADIAEQAAEAIEELSKQRENWELEAAAQETDKNYLIDENRKLVDAWHNALDLRNRWISVEDALPVHDMNVLICYEWAGQSGTVYREVGIASIEELERDPTEMFRPIAWMPLPSPPDHIREATKMVEPPKEE